MQRVKDESKQVNLGKIPAGLADDITDWIDDFLRACRDRGYRFKKYQVAFAMLAHYVSSGKDTRESFDAARIDRVIEEKTPRLIEIVKKYFPQDQK